MEERGRERRTFGLISELNFVVGIGKPLYVRAKLWNPGRGPSSGPTAGFSESKMRTLKYGLLLAAISLLAISSRAATEKEPSANLLLARQLNQAFIEVAEKVSPAVVVI